MAIVSPIYCRLSQESIHAYFREIALATPIDVTLYSISMLASPIELDSVRRLAEHERIIGIKDSSGDLPGMMRLISAVRPLRPDFVFMTGWEAALVPMLLAGCDGGTHATSRVVPELTRAVYDLTRAGRVTEAFALQYRLLDLFDRIFSAGDFPEGFRLAAGMRGFAFGPGRQPLSATPREKLDAAAAGIAARIDAVLAELGVPSGSEPS